MHQLLDSLVLKELDNDILRQKRDSAIFEFRGRRLAFTTDSYVVNPIFFPGGDIGSLAVYGTVNDLSVCGAKPLYISLALIIEEGLDKDILAGIIRSVKKAAAIAGVKVVTGDTKVVNKGACDKLFINTSGIGEVYSKDLGIEKIKPGDAVIINGSIGDHAISVLSKREGLDFKSDISSDSRPLNGLISRILRRSSHVRFMRDPTRGGVGTTLNEIVKDMPFGIAIDEDKLPVREGVRNACELLGYDPLYLACEGRVLAVVSDNDMKKVLTAMRKDRAGRSSAYIGRVVEGYKGRVYLNTSAGGKRLVDMLSGEQLPRIC